MVVEVAGALGACEGVAGLRDETLALATVEGTGHVATLTTVVALIAAYHLLSGELNGLFNLLANAISHSGHCNCSIS